MILNELLNNTKDFKDHPTWHPENSLYHHILLVTYRAYVFYNEPNLVMAGLLHDICKPIGAIWHDGYQRNVYHAKQAYDLIQSNDDIKYLIKSNGADYEIVSLICKHHMDKKVTKNNKHVPFIEDFFKLDDMVNRNSLKATRNFFWEGQEWINAKITYCGQSPLQQFNKSNKFTLTKNRTAYEADIDSIPKLINNEYKIF